MLHHTLICASLHIIPRQLRQKPHCKIDRFLTKFAKPKWKHKAISTSNFSVFNIITKMSSRPRQPVAKGGLWSPSSQPVSKETQDLLKGISYTAYLIRYKVFVLWYHLISCQISLINVVMMRESKLTNFQQRQLSERLKG